MITVTASSRDGGKTVQHPTRQFGESHDALIVLAREDFGFAARIMALNPDCLVVETNILEDVRTVTYSGPVDEMQPLVELATNYKRAQMEFGPLIDSGAFGEKIRNYNMDSPISMLMLGPKLAGGDYLKVALMLACGIDDEEDIRVALGFSMSAIMAAAQASRETGKTVGESLAAI